MSTVHDLIDRFVAKVTDYGTKVLRNLVKEYRKKRNERVKVLAVLITSGSSESSEDIDVNIASMSNMRLSITEAVVLAIASAAQYLHSHKVKLTGDCREIVKEAIALLLETIDVGEEQASYVI